MINELINMNSSVMITCYDLSKYKTLYPDVIEKLNVVNLRNQKELKLGLFWWRSCKLVSLLLGKISPLAGLDDWIGGGFVCGRGLKNKTSTGFYQIRARK
jgi:hypothetical protein